MPPHPGGEARTDSLQTLGPCRCDRVRTLPGPRENPLLGQTQKAGPCLPEAWIGEPLQGGRRGQQSAVRGPGGWASRALAPLLAEKEPGVVAKRQTAGWRASCSPTSHSALRGTGHRGQCFMTRRARGGMGGGSRAGLKFRTYATLDDAWRLSPASLEGLSVECRRRLLTSKFSSGGVSGYQQWPVRQWSR